MHTSHKAVSSGTVTFQGVVREIFGGKFIVEADGRKLVETGPHGPEVARVAVGDKVTIEGLPRDGFTHAEAITFADGRRVRLGGPPGLGAAESEVDEHVLLGAAAKAGFRAAHIQDIKKRHAEVIATDADGRPWELHIEFDGHIRKQEAAMAMTEAEITALLEKSGYAYGGAMRPEKKHMVVKATNRRGDLVEIDVHRDGSIKKETPLEA